MDAPAEVFPLAEYLYEEMKARDWTTEDVAARMQTKHGAAMDLFCLDLLMAVQDDALMIDDDMFQGLARAFDVSPIMFRRIHEQWRAHPDRRSAFDCPDDIFGPVSRRSLIRIVN